jgi:hypothetical protein
MISQCANPDCGRELHYLRDGKIYQFVLSTRAGSKRLEHFWLCGECSKSMILICVNKSEVKTVRKDGTPIHPESNPVTVWHHPKKRAL